MHAGKAYHEFMLASARDRSVRKSFQQLVFGFMPPHGTILDFGAGTGIDAKSYAAHGLKVQVHEPSAANRDYLSEYCQEEIAKGEIAISDLSQSLTADMIAANFAVLNLIRDHRPLFAKFAGIVASRGFVVVNLLNPFFLGDARYAWWRQNLYAFATSGKYAVDGEGGPIYRFAPSVVSRAAQPYFSLVRRVPGWARLAVSPYVFMLFQKC